MTRTRSIARIVVLGLVLSTISTLSFGACGSYTPPRDDPDAGVDATPDSSTCDARKDVDVVAFGRSFYEALCTSMVRCDLFTTFRTVEECVASHDRFYDGTQTKYLRAVAGALEQQIIALDQGAADRCFAELITGACPVSLDSPACQAMFRGTRAAGATCFGDEECAAEGGRCEGLVGEQACGSGTCTASAALGQACGAQTPCVPGAHCVDKTGGAVCETGDAGARCTENGDCDRALWCQQGSCVVDRQAGQPCRFDAECGGGTLCVGELSAGNGIGACSRVTTAGDVCDDYCFGALFCDIPQLGGNGSCAALPKQGEPCFTSLGRCGGVDLHCSSQDVCTPLPTEGQACSANTFCKAGFFCSTELSGAPTGTCVALAASGGACSRDGNCQSYECGGDGKCREWQACRGAAPADPCAP